LSFRRMLLLREEGVGGKILLGVRSAASS